MSRGDKSMGIISELRGVSKIMRATGWNFYVSFFTKSVAYHYLCFKNVLQYSEFSFG